MLLYKPNAVLGIRSWSHFFYQCMQHSRVCFKFFFMNHKIFLSYWKCSKSSKEKNYLWFLSLNIACKNKLIFCGYPFIKSGGGRLRSMLMGVGIRVLITSADCWDWWKREQKRIKRGKNFYAKWHKRRAGNHSFILKIRQ